ncbi:hypothetical protein [Nonomuraea sp. NPDC003804]|uniref:hypothetical protein n=1 Tax=Nonomuraea sp. NPDC003804 TaxID=3154547 RepID=UPI00339ED3EF
MARVDGHRGQIGDSRWPVVIDGGRKRPDIATRPARVEGGRGQTGISHRAVEADGGQRVTRCPRVPTDGRKRPGVIACFARLREG